MARTKRSRRAYGAGEWGRNRVRVFPDPKTGLFQVEWGETCSGPGQEMDRLREFGVVPHAVAVAPDVDDVAAVQQAVKQGRGPNRSQPPLF